MTVTAQWRGSERVHRWAPLGEVASIERKSIQPRDIASGTPYIGLENVKRGGSFNGVRAVGAGDLNSSKFIFDERHVLFGKLRPNLGKIALPDFSGVCSTDILPLLPGPELDRRFLAHFLRQPSQVELAAARATGANLPRLSPKVLASFLVPLPPLVEQRRIAAILDHTDTLRAKRRHALSLLDTLSESIFTDMFGDRLTTLATGIDRLGWFQGGLTLNRRRADLPLRANYLRVANVSRGALDLREVKATGVSEAEAKRCALCPGDLLIVEGHGNLGEVGRVARWEGQLADCLHQNHVIRFRPNRALVDSTFLEYYLNSRAGRAQFRRIAKTTSGLNTISMSSVKALRIPAVPIDRQRKFAQYVKDIRESSGRYRNGDERLAEASAALASSAFRGEL